MNGVQQSRLGGLGHVQLLHFHFGGENPDVGSFGGLQAGEPLGDSHLYDERQVVGVGLPAQQLKLRSSEGERLRAGEGLQKNNMLYGRWA